MSALSNLIFLILISQTLQAQCGNNLGFFQLHTFRAIYLVYARVTKTFFLDIFHVLDIFGLDLKITFKLERGTHCSLFRIVKDELAVFVSVAILIFAVGESCLLGSTQWAQIMPCTILYHLLVEKIVKRKIQKRILLLFVVCLRLLGLSRLSVRRAIVGVFWRQRLLILLHEALYQVVLKL